jgi:hypothetical protein
MIRRVYSNPRKPIGPPYKSSRRQQQSKSKFHPHPLSYLSMALTNPKQGSPSPTHRSPPDHAHPNYHATRSPNSRLSFPYPIPRRLTGRLRPPPHIPTYLHNNPRAWPYATTCLASNHDLSRLKRTATQSQSQSNLPTQMPQLLATKTKSGYPFMHPMQHPQELHQPPTANPKPCSPAHTPYRYRASLNQSQLAKVVTWLPCPQPRPTPIGKADASTASLTATRVTHARARLLAVSAIDKATQRDSAPFMHLTGTYPHNFNPRVPSGRGICLRTSLPRSMSFFMTTLLSPVS